tara:strand:- start:512 stop:643 length:132 start_codon:yes stop_codon:yes gene_type:complete
LARSDFGVSRNQTPVRESFPLALPLASVGENGVSKIGGNVMPR